MDIFFSGKAIMETLTVKNSDILHDPILTIKSGDLSTQIHAILCPKKKLAIS
jgi:hypothetical protein